MITKLIAEVFGEGKDLPAKVRAERTGWLILALIVASAACTYLEYFELATIAGGLAGGLLREYVGAQRRVHRESLRTAEPDEPLTEEQTSLPKAAREPTHPRIQIEVEPDEDEIPTMPKPVIPIGTWSTTDADKTPAETPDSKERERKERS